MRTRLLIYYLLAALPVLLSWLNEAVKTVLAGQEPVTHWVIAAALLFNMIYQCALVHRAYLDQTVSRNEKAKANEKPPLSLNL